MTVAGEQSHSFIEDFVCAVILSLRLCNASIKNDVPLIAP